MVATGFMDRYKGKILCSAGSLGQFGKGGATFGFGGDISVQDSAAGFGNTNDSTEDTLVTYSLPANSLDNTNRCLWIYAFGSLANNAHSKSVKLYFGAEIVSILANVTPNIGWALEFLVMKTGASTQVMSGQAVVGTTHGGCVTLTGAETDTAAIVIKVTGQTGTAAANDVVCNGFIVSAAN